VIVFGADVAGTTRRQPSPAGDPSSDENDTERDPESGDPAQGGATGTDRRGTDRRGTGTRAGRLLSAASLVPALLATAWLVAAFPLTAIGQFRPEYVVPLAVVVAVVITPLGLSLLRQPSVAIRAPWWSVAATWTVAVGFTVFAALSHDEHIVPRRDAGSYAQIGYWLAHNAGVLITSPIAAFGKDPGVLGFASPAFYQRGGNVIPQFMTGWPTVLAGVDWVGGWTGMLLTPAVIGGCAILAVSGLAARLVGARWAPLAALLTAATWPIVRSSQTTLSEPLGMLTLATGICLLIDMVVAGRTLAADRDPDQDPDALARRAALRKRIGRHAFAAGLLLSAGQLVRADFGVDFAFVLPVLGWLWLTRRPGVLPFLAGSVVGGGLGALDSLYVTKPYILVNWSSVKLMLILLALMTAVTIVLVIVMRRVGRSPRSLSWWRWVPRLGVAIVLATGIGLFVRPWVLIDHSTTDPGVISFVETMQRAAGLPADGTRDYAEESLRWVAWYVGWPLLIAAFVAAVLLTRRVLQGRDLRWLPLLLVYLCPTVLSLIRPGITPDHPWADRRLVIEVLPSMIMLAVWSTARLTRWVRLRSSQALAKPADGGRALGLRRFALRAAYPWLPVVVVVAFLVPMGIALTPVSVQRTELGEVAAAGDVCSVLRPNDTVVLIDPQWMPIVRAQCGLPVAQLMVPSPSTVEQVTESIRAAGRTPVIAGSQDDSPVPLGLVTSSVIDLSTTEDQRDLLSRPTGTANLFLQFWAVRM
jgi:hypothetical protein